MGVYIPNIQMPKSCTDCFDAGIMTVMINLGKGCPFCESVIRFGGLTRAVHPDCPLVPVPQHMAVAIEKVLSERKRQMELWGECSDNRPFEWMSILGEEFGELCEAVNETYFKNGAHPEYGGNEKIIKEAVHVAAVAVAIIESTLRQSAFKEAEK